MGSVAMRPSEKRLAIARYYGIPGAEAHSQSSLEALILEHAEVKAKLWNASLGVYDDPVGYIPPGHPVNRKEARLKADAILAAHPELGREVEGG